MRRPEDGLGTKFLTSAAIALAACAVLVAPATAGTSAWTGAQLPGAAGKVFLLGVSCPSRSLCVAVGTNNLIASSINPRAGEWNFVYAGEGPWDKTDTWPTEEIPGRQIQGVSCPSPDLCVAVTNQGNIYSTTRPTGPASSWNVTQIDGKGRNTHLFGVSCPTVSLCVAVSGKRDDQGKIFTSTDPTGGASTWQAIELGEPFEFRAVSCGSPALCVAVADDGRIVTSTNPTGDASAWQVVGAPGGTGNLRAVSCVAALLCLSGNKGGNLLSSTNPTAGLSSWSEANGGGSVQITGVSCPSASECLAVDDNGDVLTSTDPAGGRSAWSFSNLMPFAPTQGPGLEGNALFGASCPSSSLCVVTGARGQIFADDTPFADPPANEPARGLRPKRPRAKIATVYLSFREQRSHDTGKAIIRFYAKGRVRGFVCKLDNRPFKRCHSPKRYRVRVGTHVFKVRAIGLTGLEGPIAREPFTILPVCNIPGDTGGGTAPSGSRRRPTPCLGP